jgi:3-phytase
MTWCERGWQSPFRFEALERRFLMATVTPTVETAPIPHAGDSADDPAIWVHPTNPSLSTIFGTDKSSSGGIATYDLSGAQLGFLAQGATNNVDIRYGFLLGGQRVDIAVASNRSGSGSLRVYKINPDTRQPEYAGARTLNTLQSGNVYGTTLYQSPRSGKLYAFVSARNVGGNIEQWELFDNGAGLVDGAVVRTFDVGDTSEAMAVDDRTGSLYIGEEQVGVWRYDAEPTGGTARTLVDSTNALLGGHLTADVEGVAVYRTPGGKGYILVSSQGSNDFTLYHRDGANAYIDRFNIGPSPTADGVNHTDGIEVTSFGLGPSFANGVFIAHDDTNTLPAAGAQNFKLVPWRAILDAVKQ